MKISSILIDTHVLLWVLSKSKRLKDIPWIADYPVWTVSPVSLLEIKFLIESDRIDLELPTLLLQLRKDPNFYIDPISLEAVCMAALDMTWTRDPFDRLLVAHSQARGIPFGTHDGCILKNYQNVVT